MLFPERIDSPGDKGWKKTESERGKEPWNKRVIEKGGG